MAISKKILAVKKAVGKFRKGGYNPHFKNQYVVLDDVLGELNPLLDEQGVLLLQSARVEEGKMVVTTILEDVETGETRVSTVEGPLKVGASTSEAGAALSYWRRQGLLTFFSLPGGEKDDDALLASEIVPEAEKPKGQGATIIASPTPGAKAPESGPAKAARPAGLFK